MNNLPKVNTAQPHRLPFQIQMLHSMLPKRNQNWWRWPSITRWLPKVSTCKLSSSKLKQALAIINKKNNCLKRLAGRGKSYIKWAEVRKTKTSKRSTTTWSGSTAKISVEIFSNSKRDHQRCLIIILGRNLNREMKKRKAKVQAIHIEANSSIKRSLTTNS